MTTLILSILLAQDFTQRGFLETRFTFFPQKAVNDRAHVIGDSLLRWEPSYKRGGWFKVSAAIDARTDTHRQTEREWRLDADDRRFRRPAFSLRRLSTTLHKGEFTAELGRQFIRWGKTDILNPTDRFAPRDYLAVVDNDILGITAARLTWEHKGDTIDAIWQPRFTPSRIPLANQRWAVLPEGFRITQFVDYTDYQQKGIRWNHIGGGYEFSMCFFDGSNHLPLFRPLSIGADSIAVLRYFPRLRVYGGDVAVPTPWFTAKGEAAYLSSSTRDVQEYVLYVIQIERTVKEWIFVGGYAGEAVTSAPANPLAFAPDRGFARSFTGRGAYTISPTRSAAIETLVRSGGSWLRAEYSQTFGQHWRATAAFAWIRGSMADFLGQFRRNSHATLVIRYSF